MDEAFICLLYLLNLIAKLSNHAPIPRFSLICESFVWTPGLFLWQIEKMACEKRRERYIQNTGQNSLVSLNMARYTVLMDFKSKIQLVFNIFAVISAEFYGDRDIKMGFSIICILSAVEIISWENCGSKNVFKWRKHKTNGKYI